MCNVLFLIAIGLELLDVWPTLSIFQVLPLPHLSLQVLIVEFTLMSLHAREVVVVGMKVLWFVMSALIVELSLMRLHAAARRVVVMM